MNINLISPNDSVVKNSSNKTNGHNYHIRFKQDILIPAMSKIMLNFSTFTRQSEVSFTEDQTLYINIDARTTFVNTATGGGVETVANILPDTCPIVGAPDNSDTQTKPNGGSKKGNKYAVKIPKGFYTYEKFYSTITKGINDSLEYSDSTATPKVDTTTRNDVYRAIEIFDANPIYVDDSQQLKVDNTENTSIAIGIVQNVDQIVNRDVDQDQTFLFEFAPTTDHTLNNSQLDTDNTPVSFRKTSANVLDDTTAGQATQKVFDSYAIAETHYRHADIDDNTPAGKCNIIRVETLKSLEDIGTDNASVAFGLYSKEVAVGINASDGTFPLNQGNRTQGTTTENTSGGLKYVNPQQSYYKVDTATGIKTDIGAGGDRKIPVAPISVVISGEGDKNGNGAGVVKVEVYLGNYRGSVALPSPTPVNVGKNRIGGMRSIHDHTQAIFPAGGGVGKEKYNTRSYKSPTLTGSKFNANPTDTIKLGFQTYFDPNDRGYGTNEQKLYFRLLWLDNLDSQLPIRGQNNAIMFDSKNNKSPSNQYFRPIAWGKCDNTNIIDYTTGAEADGTGGKFNKIRSQIPFSPILWSNTINHGFKEVNYIGVPKGTVNGVDYETRPITLYNQYNLTATEEMAEMFNIATELVSKLNPTIPIKVYSPNTAIPPSSTLYSALSRGWRSKSYSIFLKGLPLNNYKNTSSHRRGGFGKQILANVPTPFKDSMEHFNTKTTGVFTPNTPIVSELYNQDLIVNSFEVSIKGMNDDKDATEIEESVINFTIHPPDDYKGNINGIKGFKNLPASVRPS